MMHDINNSKYPVGALILPVNVNVLKHSMTKGSSSRKQKKASIYLLGLFFISCCRLSVATDVRYTDICFRRKRPRIPQKKDKLEHFGASTQLSDTSVVLWFNFHSHAAQKARHEDVQHQPDRRYAPSVAASTH